MILGYARLAHFDQRSKEDVRFIWECVQGKGVPTDRKYGAVARLAELFQDLGWRRGSPDVVRIESDETRRFPMGKEERKAFAHEVREALRAAVHRRASRARKDNQGQRFRSLLFGGVRSPQVQLR